MSRIRIALTFVAALALYALVMPISAFAATPTTIEVSNSSEFDNAVATVNGATSGEYVIKLTDNLEDTGAVFSNTCPTTILGNGHTMTLGQYSSLSVQPGAQLNLGAADGSDALKISGGNEQSNDVPGLLHIQGTCNMYPGITIADRKGDNYFGGGVFVSGGSSFVMTGGTISNNKANEMGGGVAVVASPNEIEGGQWGKLQSSAQILDGTISGNEANDGAGVLSSAYFFNPYGLCAGTPNVGAAEKPGLFLKNTTITNNKANQDEGYGAGVLAMKMKSPAAAEIRDCTIKKNSAAVGGGVASYGNFTSLTIDGCTITGNKASNYGGGFAAESNSGEGAGTTITNTKLCNNIADKAASDVYLNGSVAKLSAAKDMNELYLGKPDDVTNKKIDGWYLDNEDSRYATQAKEQRNEYANYASIGSDGKVCLVAAAKPSLVKITFANEDGTTIYSEDWYEIGTNADQIAVPTPTKPSDDKYDYVFDSWHTTIENVTGDAVYKAQFKKVFKNFSAKYTFSSTSSDKQLPSEVLAVLPKDTKNYVYNDAVKAITPSQTTVDVANGTWIFMGYDKESTKADMTTADSEGNVTFTGSWKFVEKSDTPSAPDNSDQSGANGSDELQADPDRKSETVKETDSPSPNTADGTSVGFCYTLLIAAIVALGSAVYANSRIRRRRNY